MEPIRPRKISKLSETIQVDADEILEQLGEVVRRTLDEAWNAMLGAQAGHICRAESCEKTDGRKCTPEFSYHRHLQTKAGEATLKVSNSAQPAI